MAKQKKKREKTYKGTGAAIKPSVTRVSAVRRNPVHQWWIDHKRLAKPVSIATGVVLLVVVLLFEAIRLITGL